MNAYLQTSAKLALTAIGTLLLLTPATLPSVAQTVVPQPQPELCISGIYMLGKTQNYNVTVNGDTCGTFTMNIKTGTTELRLPASVVSGNINIIRAKNGNTTYTFNASEQEFIITRTIFIPTRPGQFPRPQPRPQIIKQVEKIIALAMS